MFVKFCRVKKACYSGFVSSGFPSKIPVKSRKIRDDNRRAVHSFRSFIYPVYSLPTQQDSVLPVTRASKIRLHCRLNGALIFFLAVEPGTQRNFERSPEPSIFKFVYSSSQIALILDYYLFVLVCAC